VPSYPISGPHKSAQAGVGIWLVLLPSDVRRRLPRERDSLASLATPHVPRSARRVVHHLSHTQSHNRLHLHKHYRDQRGQRTGLAYGLKGPSSRRCGQLMLRLLVPEHRSEQLYRCREACQAARLCFIGAKSSQSTLSLLLVLDKFC
jgi:hypothetical protein